MTTIKRSATDTEIRELLDGTTRKAPESAFGSDKGDYSGSPQLRYPKTGESAGANTTTNTQGQGEAAKSDSSSTVTPTPTPTQDTTQKQTEVDSGSKSTTATTPSSNADTSATSSKDSNSTSTTPAASEQSKGQSNTTDTGAAKTTDTASTSNANANTTSTTPTQTDAAKSGEAPVAEKEEVKPVEKTEVASTTPAATPTTTVDADGTVHNESEEATPEPKTYNRVALSEKLIVQTTDDSGDIKNFKYRAAASNASGGSYTERPAYGGKFPSDESKAFHVIYVDTVEFGMAPVSAASSTTQKLENTEVDGYINVPMSDPNFASAWRPSMAFAVSISDVNHRDWIDGNAIVNKYDIGFSVKSELRPDLPGYTGTLKVNGGQINRLLMTFNVPDYTGVRQQSSKENSDRTKSRPFQGYPSTSFKATETLFNSVFGAETARVYSKTIDAYMPIGKFIVTMYITDRETKQAYEHSFKINQYK